MILYEVFDLLILELYNLTHIYDIKPCCRKDLCREQRFFCTKKTREPTVALRALTQDLHRGVSHANRQQLFVLKPKISNGGISRKPTTILCALT